MAWKNLKQHSLSDTLQCHNAFLEELDGVDELIDWSTFEALFADIHAKRRGERAGLAKLRIREMQKRNII